MVSIVKMGVDGTISNHFFNSKVDKVEGAITRISNQIDENLRSLMTTGFTGLSMQQIELFGHAKLLLQDIQTVYSKVMNETVERAGKEVEEKLHQVDAMVYGWMAAVTKPDIVSTVSQVQAVISNFSLWLQDRPLITAFTPMFTTPYCRGNDIFLRCIGLFPPVTSVAGRPSLKAGVNTFYPVSNLSGELCFSVPFYELFPDSNETKLRIAAYSIQIPYLERGRFYNQKAVQTYQGMITLLPESPGKIVVSSVKIDEVEEKKPIVSPGYFQTSRKYGFNRTELNHPYTLSAEEGWEIVKGTTYFHVDELKGRPRPRMERSLAQEFPTHVTWQVSTYKYPPEKHCDKVRFRISAVQRRVMKKEEKDAQEMVLKWGHSFALETTGINYSIMLHAFDGTTQALTANTHGRYVDLLNKGGKLLLVVKGVDELSTFKFHELRTTSAKL